MPRDIIRRLSVKAPCSIPHFPPDESEYVFSHTAPSASPTSALVVKTADRRKVGVIVRLGDLDVPIKSSAPRLVKRNLF